MDKTTGERIVRVVQYHTFDALPFHYEDFVAWHNKKLASIPEKFRASATVSFYNDVLELQFNRPETEAEKLKRSNRSLRAKEAAEKEKMQAELKEKRDYERLKKKYEVQPKNLS